ncbi:MAG: MogA/MoaB family molybdenum cofactor biosynthesis protein [Nitrososphaerales archaeon]
MEAKHNHHTSHAAASHKHESPKKLKIALFTVSSSRFRDKKLTDETGEVALDLCKKAGHQCSLSIIDDSKSMIRLSLMKALYEDGNDAAILMGGTGLSPRDVTIEAVSPLIDKLLDGFGEIFRKISFDSIGSPALMTRSTAGTIENKPVFCLPGSPDAARLGIELALKELPHAVYIASSKP